MPLGGAAAQVPSLTPFQREAMKAIYAVQPCERDRFVLLGSPDPTPVVLCSRTEDLEQVDCAQNVGFKIGAHASEVGTLLKGAPAGGDAALRRVGAYREVSPYLALIAVGHGFAVIPTVVLLTDTQAVVVQAETTRLCDEGRNPLPLCADIKSMLSAIAQRLLK